jgi:Ca2+-binding RTX toxin-like protein
LFGEADEDTLQGGAGNDLLVGGDDDDSISGGDGDDRLRGGSGDDTMLGEAGDDLLLGGAGDDLMQGGIGSDALEGGRGADRLEGGGGDDLLVGLTLANGENVLQSEATGTDPESWGADLVDRDTLSGGEGDDLIIMGRGDTALGGAGADSFLVGPWMDAADTGVISDFDPALDNVAVFLPNSYQGAGTISIGTEGADALVRVDGAVFARVTGAAGALTPAMVSLTTTQDLTA